MKLILLWPSLSRKHLKVVFESENMKSAVLQGARSSKPANFYVNEYLTQKRSNLLYKLRIMRKQNESSISSVYSRNGTVYYKLSSDLTKQHIVCDESDLSSLRALSCNVASSQQLTTGVSSESARQ